MFYRLFEPLSFSRFIEILRLSIYIHLYLINKKTEITELIFGFLKIQPKLIKQRLVNWKMNPFCWSEKVRIEPWLLAGILGFNHDSLITM